MATPLPLRHGGSPASKTAAASRYQSSVRRPYAIRILCTNQHAEVSRKPFKFKYFEVYQDRCAMKVGTDAMLLGSWAPPPKAPHPSPGSSPSPGLDPNACPSRSLDRPHARILDVGTGTGVLALMMAQKTQRQGVISEGPGLGLRSKESSLVGTLHCSGSSDGATIGGCTGHDGGGRGDGNGGDNGSGGGGCDRAAARIVAADAATAGTGTCSGRDGSGGGGGNCAAARIVAIDLDGDAAAQAAENAARSPWSGRIRVLHASLQQLVAAAEAARTRPPAAAAAPVKATGTQVPMGASMQQLPVVASAEAARARARPPAAPAEALRPVEEASQAAPAEAPCSQRLAGEAWQAASAAPAAGPSAALQAAVQLTSVAPSAAVTTDGDDSCACAIRPEDVGPFDLIITNPPYFVASSKPVEGRGARASARHADVCLPFSVLAAGCEALLARGGSVCAVLPMLEAERFRAEAEACGLLLVELVRVFTAAEDEQERRHLMRLQRAADLPRDLDLHSLPATSVLVVNGPIARAPPQGEGQAQTESTGRGAEIAGSSSAGGTGAAAFAAGAAEDAAGVAGGGARTARMPGSGTPRHARFFTPEYLALTAEFHHPAFLAAAAAAAAAAAVTAVAAADTRTAQQAPVTTRT